MHVKITINKKDVVGLLIALKMLLDRAAKKADIKRDGRLSRGEKALIAGGVALLLIIGVFSPTINVPASVPHNPMPFLDNSTIVPLPKPIPKNNSSNATPTPKPQPQPKHIRLAVGGDVQYFNTPEKVAYYKKLGFQEVHVVVPNAGLYPEALAAIKSQGLLPVYDGEVPFWLGCSGTQYTVAEFNQLKAIHEAGWEYFASEGLYKVQVDQINLVGFHYINYGGDCAECLYTQPSFGPHSQTSHWANYVEYYDYNYKSKTYDSVLYNSRLTPEHNGILIAGWAYTRTGGPQVSLMPHELATTIKELNDNGGRVHTVLIWSGLGTNPLYHIEGNLTPTLNEIKEITYYETSTT